MSLSPEIQQRVDRVRQAVSLEGEIGRHVKLRKAGRELVGLCPFHSEKGPSFHVVPDKGFAHCFGCGWHGDVIRFVQEREGLGFRDALDRLEGLAGDAPAAPATRTERKSVREARDAGLVSSIDAARAIWAGAQRGVVGSLVEQYLRSRGIVSAASGIMGVVRFHPRCPVALWRRWESPAEARLTAPAMVAPIFRITGPKGARMGRIQGVHVTYLRPDGRGKAQLPPWQDRKTGQWNQRPSRKIFGEAKLGAVPVAATLAQADALPGMDWLDHGDGVLVVGEGLESTLSLCARTPGWRAALAALSLGNLQGEAIADGPRIDGAPSLPLHALRPQPGTGLVLDDAGRVLIGVDADMAGLKDRRVQDRPRAAPCRRDLSGAERTRICAELACAAWRRAGADHVAFAAPRAGHDFNDEAMFADWGNAA